jgi:hypothetical protein
MQNQKIENIKGSRAAIKVSSFSSVTALFAAHMKNGMESTKDTLLLWSDSLYDLFYWRHKR